MTERAPDPSAAAPAPLLPDYGAACIASVVPRLLGVSEAPDPADDWLPRSVRHATQVVLLVVDGLGWAQLRARSALAPTLSAAEGIDRAITSVAPTTTATALTSITTGRAPAEHGILGYRLAHTDGGDEILNMLRWTLGGAGDPDARRTVPARGYQAFPSFAGSPRLVPVVSKDEFGGTGFTAAHLGNSPIRGYRVPSSLPVEVGRLLADGEPLVYAYYDGIDKVAHASGFGDLYDAEVVAVDRMVSDLVALLPPGAVLLVTADHGQIEVGNRVEMLGREAMTMTRFLSGEGRFRWVHARPGAAADLFDLLHERYSGSTWVRTRDQLVDDGWFGGPLADGFADRVGDVALVPWEPIAFMDPSDTGENRLACRHGSLTTDEMLVPLVALGGERL